MKLFVYPTVALTRQRRESSSEDKHVAHIYFEDFVSGVIREYVGHKNLIDDFKRCLIIRRIFAEALRLGTLEYFKDFFPGYTRQLGVVIGELKRQNISPERFSKTCIDSPSSRDVAKIYFEYEEYLKCRDLYDREDRHLICLNHVAETDYVKGYEVVDFIEFYAMSKIQMDMVDELKNKSKVTNSPLSMNVKSIDVIAAQDERTEAYHLARTIQEDLGRGLLPQELCIVIRNPSAYGKILCEAFEEFEIPIAIKEHHSLIQNPFVRGLLSSLRGGTNSYFPARVVYSTVDPKGVGDWVRETLKILGDLHYPKAFYGLNCGESDLISRDVAAFQSLEGIMSELETTRGPLNDLIDTEGFYTLLSGLALENTYSYRPGKSGIAVISPTRMRGLDFNKIYVLGMAEGEYPRDFRPDWLLDEVHRKHINRGGYNLDTLDALIQRERESFDYLTSAAETMYFSYPLARDADTPNLMSSYLEDLMSQCGEFAVERVSFKDVYRLKGMQGDIARPVDEPLNIPMVDEHLRKPLSASGVNTYGQCPYKYFLERVLKLSREPEEGEYNAMTRGGVMHKVLEEFFSRRLGQNLRADNMDEYQEEIATLVRSSFEPYYSESFEHPKLYDMECSAMINCLQNYLQYHIEIFGEYKVLHVEYSFGFDAPFSLRGIPCMNFRGVVDRIDIGPEGEIAVIDYKTNWTPSIDEIVEGTNLQLPLYILAVQDKLGMPVKGGAFISLKKSVADNILVRDKTLSFVKRKRKGVLDEEKWQELMEHVVTTLRDYGEGIRKGHFPIDPKKCPKIQEYGAFCEFEHICPMEVSEE